MFEIKKETLETHEVMLTVTLDDETKQQAMKKAARKIARHVNIPGFRRGRAPYQVIKQYVGESAILDEALDDWLEEAYSDILEQAEIDPYGPGSLVSRATDPLTVKIRVPLVPTVNLGDYRNLRVEWQEPEIDEETVAADMEKLREQYAMLEPVDRPANWGDMVVMDITGTSEEMSILSENGIEAVLKEDAPIVVPGIAEEIIGMAEGDEKTFTLTLPDEETFQPEELRGKEASFTVQVHEVYDRQLPELDDAFALTVGNFDSLEALKENIRQDLYENALEEAREAYREQALAALVEMAEIHYPPEVVTNEIHEMYYLLDQQLSTSGFRLEDLLRLRGQTKEQYYAELQPQAVQHVEAGLVLRSLIHSEHIEVTEEELESLPEYQEAETQVEKERIASYLLEQKTMERLEMIARGELPEEEEEVASEEAPEDTAEA